MNFPAAVIQSGQLNDDIYGRGGLFAQSPLRQVDSRHQHHRFQTGKRITRAIGMDRTDRTVMTGVHRLHHVERLTPAHLADDDAIRSHT